MAVAEASNSSVDVALQSLNQNSHTWQKVEFRCMIQDILGNELYTKHNSDKYSDRTIFYCVTIPGENEWVRTCADGDKNEFMTNLSIKEQATIANNSHNNSIHNDATTNTNTNDNHNNSSHVQCTEEGDSNRHNNSHNTNNSSAQEKIHRISLTLVNWSFPIPSDFHNKSCLIKVYDEKLVEKLRVNDIVLVTGIVEPNDLDLNESLDLTKQRDSDTSKQNESAPNEPTAVSFDSDFEPAVDFPHHLVPRVHVSSLKKLVHINPLLPELITNDYIDDSLIKLARSRLSTILTQLFAGDSLVAEYLILSLVSHIHRRKDVTALGHFTLGITGITQNMKFLIAKVYEIITKITTHSHMIDMSIANLNNLRFTPQKDYENNKMIAGTLQLPDGMYVLLNETALGEGQLTSQGTENLSTLNQIIRWQKHSYDFKYQVEIDTDLKVLVLSEGKSILTVPYQVKLNADAPNSIETMKAACDSVNDFLSDELLNMFRKFITIMRSIPDYSIPEDVEKQIQEDFAMWRRRDENEGRILFSGEDLSSYMTVARYVCLSRGERCLTSDIWKETCNLENARQATLRA